VPPTPTKLIWFVLGLGISSLVLTGMWISQKRRVKGAAKRKAQRMGVWKYVNGAMYDVHGDAGRYVCHADYPLPRFVVRTVTYFCRMVAVRRGGLVYIFVSFASNRSRRI
jgi:hypothetical protein